MDDRVENTQESYSEWCADRQERYLKMANRTSWEIYKKLTDAPYVNDFNSSKIVIEDTTEPEIFTFNEVTPEQAEKILKEFETAAQVAGVKPIEGHPIIGDSGLSGEDKLCPILNDPDAVMLKVAEVFYPDSLKTPPVVVDKHFLTVYLEKMFQDRNFEWRGETLYVDGARTTITYAWIATKVIDRLQDVF